MLAYNLANLKTHWRNRAQCILCPAAAEGERIIVFICPAQKLQSEPGRPSGKGKVTWDFGEPIYKHTGIIDRLNTNESV